MRELGFFMLLFFTSIGFGQTATIHVEKVFPNVKETNKFIKFEINGHHFGEKDSIIKIPINTLGFDNCKAIIDKDTIRFSTKFRNNETYLIRQGCCCAAFTLEAKNNPKRGTVAFENKTKKALGLVIAESNMDTIQIGKKKTIFASESAMCYYKPCPILLVETDYFSTKYDYHSDDRDYDTLWKERDKYVIDSTWFHFLHGEKISIYYDVALRKLEFQLDGYLTKKEYLKAISE